MFEKSVFFTEPRPLGSVFSGKVCPLPYGRGSEKGRRSGFARRNIVHSADVGPSPTYPTATTEQLVQAPRFAQRIGAADAFAVYRLKFVAYDSHIHGDADDDFALLR